MEYYKDEDCQVMDANDFKKAIAEWQKKAKRQKYEKSLRFKIKRFFAKRRGEIA